MKVSIIIVSYKVKDLLKKCLESIESVRANSDLEIFIVDNYSNDGTVEMISQYFLQVKLIASDNNLGFAKANNLAIKQATGDYILLLNPDTEISKDTILKSIEFMASHPKCGVMAPRMLYPDGSSQPSVRRFPTIWPVILMLLKLPKLFPHLKSIDRYLAADFDYSKEQPVDQVMGAFMLMPKNTLDKVGLLDERFFNWFEEVDLCRRFILAGYEIWYTPTVSIIHHGGKSFAQQGIINNQKVFFTSAFKYFMKYIFV